jgi:hypothetical protein
LTPGARWIARSPIGCLYEDTTPPPAVSPPPGAAASPANGPAASAPPPWWLTTAVTTCNAPAAYRLPDGSQRLGSCTGLLVDPPATVAVHLGDQVEIHMTETSPGGHPSYAIPRSTDTDVLSLDSAWGNTTAVFRAKALGTAWLVSSGQCLQTATNAQINGNCPVLAVVVSGP